MSKKSMVKFEFVLIWWLTDKLTQVLPIKNIPLKSRKVNEIVNLSWVDEKSKKKMSQKAKVLALAATQEELNELNVDSEGVIRDQTVKLYTPDVMEQKKELKSKKKSKNLSKKEEDANFTHQISLDKLIFTILPGKKNNNNSFNNVVPINTDSTSSSSENLGANIDLENYSSDSESDLSENEDENEELTSKATTFNNDLRYILFPNGVTERDVENMRNYLHAMEAVLEMQRKEAGISLDECPKIPAEFTTEHQMRCSFNISEFLFLSQSSRNS